MARLRLSPLGLVWLGRLARWHALDFEQKNPWNLSKRAPTLARFEVEHDFLKTRVPRGILKLVCPPPQLDLTFKPIRLVTSQFWYTDQVYIYS